jgi:NET1-associated nuclear protein 1 (U3 small nucleolar RNA-associated protein 17)
VKGRVICYNLTSGKQIPGHLAKTRYVETLCVSPGGGLVGIADDHKAWVWMVPQQGTIDSADVVPWTILHHTKRIMLMAFDSAETRVAAGDHTGRILVWENVGDRSFTSGELGVGKFIPPPKHGRLRGAGVRGKDDAASCATYHWHSNEVKALTFTVDGVYLLSGGLEGVLVFWQLETGKRNYLPRLGGAVFSIAPSLHPSLFAIACNDNSVNIGTMEVERNIQGIKPPFPMPKQLTMQQSMVAIEPSEGKMVVATHNLSLQFYDSASDKHVAELQVTPRNYVTGGRDQEDGLSTCVTHVAFSADGSCMATVDVRVAEHDIGGGACLKFWDRQPGNLKFSINTQIDERYGEYANIQKLLKH